MKPLTLLGTLAGIVALACMPLRPAYAYIDPNTAGALYQLLFPLLIAIGSIFAFLRRKIISACVRVSTAVWTAVRGERSRTDRDRKSPSRHVE